MRNVVPCGAYQKCVDLIANYSDSLTAMVFSSKNNCVYFQFGLTSVDSNYTHIVAIEDMTHSLYMSLLDLLSMEY